jgi:hypothetical protein
MPIHTAPYFRNKELALEASGLIVTLNSDGYNQLKAAQAAGQAPVQVPLITFNFNGKMTPAKE